MTEPIDYDRLWRAYQRSLVDTLRGFESGVAGLEHFVPQEDPARSLRHLLDAAAAAGRSQLCVRFGPETREGLTAEPLRAALAGYGHVRVLATEREVVVEVTELRPAAAEARAIATRTIAATAHATTHTDADAYAAALAAPGPYPHEGRLEGDLVVGTRLQWAVDATTHVIVRAGFTAGGALLERFAALCEGLPVLEAAYHGVQRLEAALRAHGARPVAGVITPRAAHAMFAEVEALARAALVDYRARTGYAERVSRHDPGPGPRWRQASASERARLVAEATADLPVALAAIEHDVRLVFRVTAPGQDAPALLRALEARIARDVDARLEVHAEVRKDKNPLRVLGRRAGQDVRKDTR